jgi:group II intron reverse transcriptase/maturase
MSACRTDTPAARSDGERVETKLRRIAVKARSEPRFVFTSLFHLMNTELLRACFDRLRRDAATGMDGMSKEMYGEELEERLEDLEARLHRLGYRPLPSRRTYIPKPGSVKGRPLGIPAVEDKIVQAGLAAILGPIYEADFIDDSYGFRPGRSCHDALRALSHTVESGRVNWIVEADIKGFFDHVRHEWLMKFLGHRIHDKRVLRYIERFLKAGVMEDEAFQHTDEGTPQGGVISPLLANVYLHYALDLWFERRFRKSCRGYARLIRYADDFVVCFERRDEAERFHAQMQERLAQFALETEPSKTKVLAFGPRAADEARRQGCGKPETFDFLGFTHYCSRSRNGRRFRMKRTTARKKFRAKLAAYQAWLKANRSRLTNRQLWETTRAKLRGHFVYYGVTDNWRAMNRYAFEVRRLLLKWLNRKGGQRRMNWEKFNQMNRLFPLPTPRIHAHLLPSW